MKLKDEVELEDAHNDDQNGHGVSGIATQEVPTEYNETEKEEGN